MKPLRSVASGAGQRTAESLRNARQRVIEVQTAEQERRRQLPLLTSTGVVVLILAIAAHIASWQTGWRELAAVAGGGYLAVIIALGFTLGRAALDVELDFQPSRVVAGNEAVGRVEAVNNTTRRVLPVSLEARIGEGELRIPVPSLAAGASFDEVFIVPCPRRTILTIGPVRTVRGDPLGLASRPLSWSDSLELYVHPRTVRIAGLTAGWLRDLEGRPTNDLSPSDIAFHTLREYVPGDDRRHIHWRTTARLGRHMVRQYVDSRRAHLGILLDTDVHSYEADEEEFELAVSVVGSLGVGALIDGQDVSLVVNGARLASHQGQRLLDGLSGVEQSQHGADLRQVTAEARRSLAGASVVAIVVGSAASIPAVRTAADRLPREVQPVIVRCDLGASSTMRTLGQLPVLTVGSLQDLPRMLAATATR